MTAGVRGAEGQVRGAGADGEWEAPRLEDDEAAAPDESGERSWWERWRGTLIRVVVGLVVVGALYFAGRTALDIRAALVALAKLDPRATVPIVLFALAHFILKGLRWHYFLWHSGVRSPMQRSVTTFLAGEWFTFTPVGEYMRAYLLVGKERFLLAAPTVPIQSWVEMISLALTAVLMVAVFPRLAGAVLPVALPFLVAIALVLWPSTRALIARLRPARWVMERVSGTRWAQALRRLMGLLRPRPIGVGLLLSVPVVLTGALGFYYAAHAVGLEQTSYPQALTAFAMLFLLGRVSPLPRGVGLAEGSGTFYLSRFGVDPTDALVAVLLFRAAMIGLSLVVGLLAFLVLRWLVPDLASVSIRGTRAPWIPVRQRTVG